jgi:hypothetical protein
LTDAARDATGANDAVDKGHAAYTTGEIAGDYVDRALTKGSVKALNSLSSTTRRGVLRRNTADWRVLRDTWDRTGIGDILSPANRRRIAKGQTPIVDDDWINYFPGDGPLKGEKIPLHHIDGNKITVPLPASRHRDAHMPGGFRRNPGGPGRTG